MNKFASTSILEATQQRLDTSRLSSSKIVLGVSGGPDSMALLYLFHKLGVHTFAVHINYGLRGNQSDADQELVEGMCSVWGIEACTVRLDGKPESGNFQQWARERRYQIFNDFKRELKADAIATAHNRDDQVETVFQKIMRGSNPATWKGMRVWDGVFLRPLLPLSKQQILEFCENEAVPFHIDESNLESKYARNFLRNELAEQMNVLFPGWKENILALQDYASFFDEAVDLLYNGVVSDSGISISKFENLSGAFQHVVLKKFIQDSTSATISRGLLKELVFFTTLQTGKRITIDEEYFLLKGRNEIVLEPKKKSVFNPVSISKKNLQSELQMEGFVFERKEPGDFSGDHIQLDEERLNWPLTLRAWKQGDRFQPLGMSGTQKVSDHLTNKKIPAKNKQQALILCGADGTICALIYPGGDPNVGAISELVKITPKTQKVLSISLKE
ncbi:MAG: tRNA lysidine(34) synthetase TilS [Balneolales bacterium]|nr:tRNA lysidine(34) synthetase TilS [Balneolales bacterium]